MNTESDAQLSLEERQAFDDLPREKAPPPLLEDRVVQSLQHSGLIRSGPNFSSLHATGVGLAVAASLLFFVLGVLFMKWFSPSAPTNTSPDFMLVLRENQATHASREEELRIAKEYGSWARELMGRGVLSDGEKLMDEARTLTLVDGRLLISKAETNQRDAGIAGYFLIKAQNYEQAMKIAESCPHLKYGGTIEVRQIDRF
jgi:hypothetical protein